MHNSREQLQGAHKFDVSAHFDTTLVSLLPLFACACGDGKDVKFLTVAVNEISEEPVLTINISINNYSFTQLKETQILTRSLNPLSEIVVPGVSRVNGVSTQSDNVFGYHSRQGDVQEEIHRVIGVTLVLLGDSNCPRVLLSQL